MAFDKNEIEMEIIMERQGLHNTALWIYNNLKNPEENKLHELAKEYLEILFKHGIHDLSESMNRIGQKGK